MASGEKEREDDLLIINVALVIAIESCTIRLNVGAMTVASNKPVVKDCRRFVVGKRDRKKESGDCCVFCHCHRLHTH